jgi:peptidylprolyl isomerase
VKRLTPILVACIALAVAGCGGSSDSSSSSETSASTEATTTESSSPAEETSGSGKTSGKTKPTVTVPKNVSPKQFPYQDIEKGTGAVAKKGDTVTVQYVGVGYDSEEEFDSSWSRNEPFTFTLGAGEVIKGWDKGVVGMKVGGRRELVIPANLAYGANPPSPAIAPNEALVFVIDLLAVE